MTSTGTSTGTSAPPLRPAAQRTGAGPVGWVGPAMAVLVTLLGLVLLRDGVLAPAGSSGWPGDQPSWVATATTGLDGLVPAVWMVPAGVATALVGVYLLTVALRRRTRRTLALAGGSGAYLLLSDVARRAAAAAHDVDGVLDASAGATRRRVSVTAVVTGGAGGAGGAAVGERVTAAVAASLAALDSPPAVVVRTSSGSAGDGTDLT